VSAPVVAVHRLPADVEARVRDACLRAGARPVASDALGDESPSLLVAHLPRRVRRIPADVLATADRIAASLPLLLACDEALVHPTTTLRVEGVTLVEHAATDRLYSQIRILLAARRPRAAAHALGETLEDGGAFWWLGVVGGAAAEVTNEDALSVLLPLGPNVDGSDTLAAAHGIVTTITSADVSSALIDCLGSDAGFVHLSREACAWTLYWPAGTGSLWLFSSHRLPHLSELSRASDVPRILRSVAQPGEVVLATNRALRSSEQRIAQGLADGGPSTVDRLRVLPEALRGFVVEVR
jgi:hypothetical protein